MTRRRRLRHHTEEPESLRPVAPHIQADHDNDLPAQTTVHPADLQRPTTRTILALQQQGGNHAVRRLLANQTGEQSRVDRQPAPTKDKPMIGPIDPDYAFAEEVSGEFQQFLFGLSQAQFRSHTLFRENLLQRLTNETQMQKLVDQGAFDNPSAFIPQITQVAHKIDELKAAMKQEKERALKEQFRLGLLYTQERERILSGSRTKDVHAVKILDEMAEQTVKIVGDMGEFLAVDDLAMMDYMLKHQTHVTKGEEADERERTKLREEQDRIEAEIDALGEDDSPGILGTIWSVVGWDSFGEFLLDVGLTVATGGISKVAKVAKKGNKARKLSKVRKAAKAARLAKRLKKLEKLGEAALGLIETIKKNPDKIQDAISWVRENAGSIAKKVATDLIANGAATVTTGKSQSQASVVTGRLRKEYIQYVVDETLDISGETASEYVKLMLFAAAAGKKDSVNRLLQAFLMISLRRRGLANLIHAFINKTGTLDFPDSPDELKGLGVDLANVAVSTAGEMLQDFVMALPFVSEYKDLLEGPIETARKFVVNLIRTTIGN